MGWVERWRTVEGEKLKVLEYGPYELGFVLGVDVVGVA